MRIIVNRLATTMVSGLAALAAGASGVAAPGPDAAPSFETYAMSEGFELFARVHTSNCPAVFVEVWKSDYDRLRQVSEIFDSASRDYQQQKAALLAEKTWWGAPAYSEAARDGTDALHGIKLAADESMAIAEWMAPRGVGHAYKVLTDPQAAYEIVSNVREGQIVKATYTAASLAELIPANVKPVSDLIANFAEWQESRQDFDQYRNELRKALSRLDASIVDAGGRIRLAQKNFRAVPRAAYKTSAMNGLR